MLNRRSGFAQLDQVAHLIELRAHRLEDICLVLVLFLDLTLNQNCSELVRFYFVILENVVLHQTVEVGEEIAFSSVVADLSQHFLVFDKFHGLRS
jgi:hypothetical protein